MTYRDDHEAALRRAEALEVELEAARADAVTARQALDASETERARLADELARTPLDADAPRPSRPIAEPPPRPLPPLDLIAQLVVVALLALCLVVVIVMLTL